MLKSLESDQAERYMHAMSPWGRAVHQSSSGQLDVMEPGMLSCLFWNSDQRVKIIIKMGGKWEGIADRARWMCRKRKQQFKVAPRTSGLWWRDDIVWRWQWILTSEIHVEAPRKNTQHALECRFGTWERVSGIQIKLEELWTFRWWLIPQQEIKSARKSQIMRLRQESRSPVTSKDKQRPRRNSRSHGRKTSLTGHRRSACPFPFH